MTNEEYARFLAANPEIEKPSEWGNRAFNSARQPVVGVTWDDARLFAEWVGCRLATEAEWEYAARAGTHAPFLDGATEEGLTRDGVPFLGFSVRPDLVRARPGTARRFRRRLASLEAAHACGDITEEELATRLASVFAHLSAWDTHGLRADALSRHRSLLQGVAAWYFARGGGGPAW